MSLYFDEQEAVEELQRRGYRVFKESYPDFESIRTAKDLLEYFYARRKFYNPERRFPESIDHQGNTKVLSSLIRSRQKLGLSRQNAVRECAELIENMFKYEKHLYLKEPIISVNILAVRPIMDRVCSIANEENKEVVALENNKFLDQFYEDYEKTYGARDDDDAKEKRKEILEALDGKE
jgi:hypothetical protein